MGKTSRLIPTTNRIERQTFFKRGYNSKSPIQSELKESIDAVRRAVAETRPLLRHEVSQNRDVNQKPDRERQSICDVDEIN
jgi:hypothetical protein